MTDYTPFCCRHCHHHLAVTNGERVVLGEGAYSDEAIPLRCSSCGCRRIWKPVKKVVDASERMAYTTLVPA